MIQGRGLLEQETRVDARAWPGRGEFLHNDGREAKQRHGRRQEGKRGKQELLEVILSATGSKQGDERTRTRTRVRSGLGGEQAHGRRKCGV